MGIKSTGNPSSSFRGRFDQTTQGKAIIPSGGGGGAPPPPTPAPISASGGTTFTADGYTYHAFPGDGTFTVSSGGPMEIEYFLVGGGGAGSDRGNGTGGGGAGGVLTNMPLSATTPDAGHARIGDTRFYVSPGPYTVVIGVGAAAGADNIAGQGEPTEFYSTPLGRNHPDGLQAFGGGYGGYSTCGGFGGCGGGADNDSKPTYEPVMGDRGKAHFYPGPFAQGFPGGSGVFPSSNGNGGGGGAGGAGTPGPPAQGADGGIGVKAPWIPASYGAPGPGGDTSRWFAGGGGSSCGSPPGGKGGGPGGPYAGGGNGTHQNSGTNGTSGTSNTGGGGGGGADGNTAGDGGSGFCIIRYQN